MNDAYYTVTAERPDLAAIDSGVLDGFIGEQLYPTRPVMDKTGTVYYMAVASVADSAAQTNRSAGVAPTGTQIATSSTTWTAAEAVKRGSFTPDEAKEMGGVARAEVAAARFSKRSVLRARETAIATQALTGTAAATFDPAKFNTQVQTQLDALDIYPGKSVMVGAKSVIKALVNQILGDSKQGLSFSRIVSGVNSTTAAQGLSFEAYRQALANWLGVDDVLVGNSQLWNSSQSAGIQNRIIIAKADNSGDELSHKYIPVLGKVFQFMPDGVQPFVMKSIRDDLNVNNHVDGFTWYNIVEFNSGARKIIDGIAP